jgi:hypothetical protein
MLTYKKIQDIVNQNDLVLRNLQITQGYHDLALGMKGVIGGSNVNWPAFATHASKTAGYAIRQEVFPERLTNVLVRYAGFKETADFLRHCMVVVADGSKPCFDNLPGQFLTRIARSVSEGNTIVFAELAYPFSQMIEVFSADWVYDEATLGEFIGRFRPGSVDDGGQDLLIEAFTAYYQARFTHDRKMKAELVLRANFLVGLHEQIRLQPAIARALTTPAEVLLKEKLPLFSVLPNGTNFWEQLTDLSREIAAAMATNSFMFISVPSGDLLLSRDVRSPVGEARFPMVLQTLTDYRLRELVKQWDRGLDTLAGSAAANWAKLEDRMRFIVDMFRSYQQNYSLFNAPFGPLQTAEILAGRAPEGGL